MADMKTLESGYLSDLGNFSDWYMKYLVPGGCYSDDYPDGEIEEALSEAADYCSEEYAYDSNRVDPWIGENVDLVQETMDRIGINSIREAAVYALSDELKEDVFASMENVLVSYAAHRISYLHNTDSLDDGYWHCISDRASNFAHNDSFDDLNAFIDDAMEPSSLEAYAAGVPFDDILI